MRMRPKLALARSYFRVAAKKSKAGDFRSAEHYRKIAYQLVDRDHAEQEARARREKAEKEYRAKVAARKAAQV
jgi:hypothetical protein